MSTGHPLTDEQIDALVDELQDRLGDSTARKVGRRGVLAALGLATLGTGSASAQASGSVGTSSSPVDVFGYDVDASNYTDEVRRSYCTARPGRGVIIGIRSDKLHEPDKRSNITAPAK